MGKVRLDEVGIWSEVKLEIIRRYAVEYSTILSKQSNIRRYIYIDGFAGAGRHVSKTTGKEIPGSPSNALDISPRFTEYHWVDLNSGRVAELKRLAKDHPDVTVYEGDCNSILLSEVFPRCRFEDYSRALCLLDPYGLNVNWQVLKTAGRMKSIEVFYNFMIMDANMNVLWSNPDHVSPVQAARMDSVWGDDSWRSAAYKKQAGLFFEISESVATRR
jgi:three-Cys-motif partner protein